MASPAWRTVMRGLGLFLGSDKRNDPVELVEPRPIERTSISDTGSPAHDGYELLSRADPNYQGDPPPISGTAGRTHRHPDFSFEQ